MKGVIRRTWQDPFKRYTLLGLVLLGILLIAWPQGAAGPETGMTGLSIDFYYQPGCSHCAAQEEYHSELLAAYPDLTINAYDITTSSGREAYRAVIAERGITQIGTPTTIVGNETIIGFGESTPGKLRAAIDDLIAGTSTASNGEIDTTVSIPFIGDIEAAEYSLPVLAIILGLVDGFNPCAMWVLVYLISIIVTLKDRKKIWLLVGSFVLASGILYYLFMTAWLNAFLLLGYVRILTILIGCFALWIGANNLRDYFTKGALECDVGDAQSKKRTTRKIDQVVYAPLSVMTVLGIIGLAFIVNSIEFVCSSAIPAVFTHVLAMSGVPTLHYYLYILLYVLFFMLDDLIIFGLAAFAVNMAVGEKYAKACKLIGGVVMLALGALLLFAPNLL